MISKDLTLIKLGFTFRQRNIKVHINKTKLSYKNLTNLGGISSSGILFYNSNEFRFHPMFTEKKDITVCSGVKQFSFVPTE